MNRKSISSYQDKDIVESTFMVKEKNVSVGKNGRPFMAIILGDNTGSLDGRVWDKVDEISSLFDVGDIVRIKGAIQIFQNRKQLVIHKLEKVEASEYQISDFIPAGKHNPEDLFVQLKSKVNLMKNDHLRQLILDTIEDSEIRPLLLKAPAAKSIHHAWIGGLLEHILSMTQIMDFMGDHYNFLNKDLLYFGAIYHDIGKLWELTYEDNFGYSDKGRLLGHMQLACELIDKKSQRILGFNEELRILCKHIILSHHGKLEFGSPKRPKCMEALIVAMVDEFDSKVSTIFSFIESERNSGEKWSRYNDMFERYFLLDNLKEKFE